MRRPPSILLLALAAPSCSTDRPAPVLYSVDPPAVSLTFTGTLTVRGDNFFADVSASFDQPAQSTVNAGFDLELVHPDGRRFPLTGVTLIDQQTITGSPPTATSPQTYALLLVDPWGRIATLPGALQIYQGDCAINNTTCYSGNPCVTNETCQGHKCVGTPVTNGTSCQVQCPTAGHETCQNGVCTLLPAGC